MLTPEEEIREQRVRDAIRQLEPEPGQYEPCGIEEIDKAYPLIMKDRPRQSPETCMLRKRLVRTHLDEIESALS